MAVMLKTVLLMKILRELLLSSEDRVVDFPSYNEFELIILSPKLNNCNTFALTAYLNSVTTTSTHHRLIKGTGPH